MDVKKGIVLLCFIALHAMTLYSQHYPVIENLNSDDFIFKQLIADIQENQKRLARAREPLPLIYYGYVTKKDDNLYKIAARLNITYDSIATLNSLPSPLLLEEGRLIFLPNMSGLALRSDETDSLLKQVAGRMNTNTALEAPLYREDKVVDVSFFPNERFNAEERKIFLLGFFRSPLNGYSVVTSGFGSRSDPFGSGGNQHHNGIDYRSPMGSNAYASRGGKVAQVARNNVLGLYVVVNHEKGYQTVYGHLSEALVRPGDWIKTGSLIAKTGNSGNSTGPHLHFEIRKNGKPINPTALIRQSAS